MTKDGGPAFPVLHSIDGNWVKEPLDEFCGMSLRDYFAAAALQGFCACSGGFVIDSSVSRNAYRIADDMLKARGE